jgi:antitoxin CcdA
MNMLYNPEAPKKPTNLSLNSDLVQKAKEENINLSFVVEAAIAEELKKRREEEWKQDNINAISNYNHLIDNIGLFSDGIRGF